MKEQSRLDTIFCSILTLIENTQVIDGIHFRFERKHIVERSGTLFAFLGTSSFRWHGWLRKKAGRSASGVCSGFGRDLEHRHDQLSTAIRVQCPMFGHPSQRVPSLSRDMTTNSRRQQVNKRGEKAMIGSLWTRLRPAAMVVTLGLCFLASSPLTAMSQDPPAEAAAAAPAEEAAPKKLSSTSSPSGPSGPQWPRRLWSWPSVRQPVQESQR